MSQPYTQEQINEISKILDMVQKMEGIVRNSPNRSQVERVQKEMRKYGERLAALVPGVDPSRVNVLGVREQLGLTGGPTGASSAPAVASTGASSGSRSAAPESRLDILNKYPMEKATPNSSDPDVNFLATILRVIQREYWPVISEQHCKLDFSTSAERDGIRTQLENVMRNLKVLSETIEEYALAEKQDFREQLLKMKNRQTRIFMFETNDVLKKLKEFLAGLEEDIYSGGGVILNKKEILRFNPKFEHATALEGRTVSDGILEFQSYVTQAIERLHLPDMKGKA